MEPTITTTENMVIKGGNIIVTRTITETYSKKELEKRIAEIEKELEDIEKQPDEILVPNDFKFQRKISLEMEKEEIMSKLK